MLAKLKNMKSRFWVLIAIAVLIPYLLEIRAINVFISTFFTHMVFPAVRAVISPVFNLYIWPLYDHMVAPLFQFFKSNPEIAPVVSVLVALLAVIITQFWFDHRQRKEHAETLKLKHEEKRLEKKEEAINHINETKLYVDQYYNTVKQLFFQFEITRRSSASIEPLFEIKSKAENLILKIRSNFDTAAEILHLHFTNEGLALTVVELSKNSKKISDEMATFTEATEVNYLGSTELRPIYTITEENKEYIYREITRIQDELEPLLESIGAIENIFSDID
ncbi:hypothetical protein L1D44_04845 [Shewanella sp. Isolate13]|uniref:hypothetical protein n=1 Tax=Shewanella sp. Isolate13 TaxID=2908531 RepID=UPI001EFEEE01|nr:hypothetical protein [Shewanella sp. Isolate13]MCG9729171.1 hypothetical protein [Shewanella sp. Isolate13]